MPAATILAACGIAFFLRFIRAVSQGGIQIGFHAEEAGKIAAQTAMGAAELFGVSNYGLGQKLWFFYSLHQMDSVVVYMIILGLIGLVFDMIFRYYVDRYFLRWRTGEVA